MVFKFSVPKGGSVLMIVGEKINLSPKWVIDAEKGANFNVKGNQAKVVVYDCINRHHCHLP